MTPGHELQSRSQQQIDQLADVRRAGERDVEDMSADELVMDQPTIVSDGPATVPESPRATLPRRARNALLVVHIALSVALLGDVLALSAVTLKAMGADDPERARTSYEIMSMFSLAFGIPLSMGALLTGLALGWGTRWGILRYPWVIAKLGLIVAVILVGSLVIGPAEGRLLDDPVSDATRSQAEGIVLAGGLFDVVALLTAIGLSVFKPGRRRVRAARP